MAGEWIAILAVLCFVGSNVIFRRTEKEASPTFINFIRTAIGTITFFLLSFFFNLFLMIFSLPLDLWLLLFASFLFGQVIGDTSYFQAQKELGTTIAMAISMTFPLFTFIFSFLFLNRPFEINLVFSLILISIGIVIIGKAKIKSENNAESPNKDLALKTRLNQFFSKTSLKAIIFGLFAALGWATGLIMIDFATNEINRILSLGGLSSVIGNVIRFPFALLILSSMAFSESFFTKKGKFKPLNKKTSKTWILLILASILGTSIGAYVYTEAARVAKANVMALIASAAPLFSLPLTYLLNKEKITILGFVGVFITFFGVIIILI